MVKEIIHDEEFLSRRSEKATKKDKSVAYDLLDTLKYHKETCVGLAANMIGIEKRIIVINMSFMDVIMFNPKIVNKSKPYKTVEGCLSLLGERETLRYDEITVEYQDMDFKPRRESFTGFIAEIIQHECDHLDGVLI